MSAFITQNFTTIAALAIAFVPLIVTVAKLLGTRTEKIKSPFDTSIRVIEIKRIPLDESTWRELTLIEFRQVTEVVLFSTAIFIILLNVLELLGFWLQVVAVLIFLFIIYIFSKIAVNFFTSSYKYRCRNAEEAKFYVFQDASILVEAELDYIFFKAQEAIIGKHVKYIDADANTRTIHAHHAGGITTTRGIISVVIQTIDELTNCHSITIHFSPTPDNFKHFFAQMIPPSLSTRFTHFSLSIKKSPLSSSISRITRPPSQKAKGIEARAKVINHFLENFLTTAPMK